MKTNTINVLKKSFFLAFILIVITIVISIIIRYDVEGEKALPYSLEKILIVSTIDANDNQNNTENLWDINLKENNNLFIYIQKDNLETKETIKEIKIDDFKITQEPKKGKIKIYRPTGELGNELYKYSEQNYLNSQILYKGDKVDTLKSLEIRNEGGMIGFRISLEEIGNYISNDTESEGVTYNGSLLSELGISNQDIQFSMSFNITITLSNNVSYLGTINIDLPCGDIIHETELHLELTDFSNIIFKRI